MKSTCLMIVLLSTFPFKVLSQGQPQNTPSVSSPDLCIAIDDYKGTLVNVKYYAREKSETGHSNQKFTVILLPDTQYYTEVTDSGGSSSTGGTIDMFKAQTTWIANNREKKNIVYVGQLGDCVQNGDDAPGNPDDAEWVKASNAIAAIENPTLTGLPEGIPFGICVGNHDQTPTGIPTGTTNYYNQYFGITHFNGRNYYGGHYGNNNDNHFQLFSAGGIDFIVISLEYDQTTEFTITNGALDWAEKLIQSYSNRKVMVMTHYGINGTGSPKPAFSIQGQAIYDRLKQYPNFILFTCAHVVQADGEAMRSDSFNGNTVHTLLSDYQGRQNGGNGLLRIMEFDPALNKISVKTYSPYTDSYETDADSQFDLNVNLNENPFTLVGEIENAPSGSTQCINWTNLNKNSEYEWFVDISNGGSVMRSPVYSKNYK